VVAALAGIAVWASAHLASGPTIAAASAATGTAAGASARRGPDARSPARARQAKAAPRLDWSSRTRAIALTVRGRGWSLRDEHHPDAAPHQLVEAVEIVRDGDVLVRLDVFANPNRETAAEWLDGDQRPLGLAAKDVQPIAAPAGAPRGTSALRLHVEHASQSQARTLALITTSTQRLRLTCEDAEDPDAVAAFAAALAGLSWPQAQGARGGR